MRITQARAFRAGAGLLALIWLCAFPAAGAEQERLAASVTYRIPEGIYINAGFESGLDKGVSGTMVLEDGRRLVFDVLHVSRSSALLRLSGGGAELVGTLLNRRVELIFERPNDIQQLVASEAAAGSADEEPFVPLLAPPKVSPEITSAKNITHGRVGIRQTFQGGTEGEEDYAVTRLDTAGSIDRLFGSGWSFIWSGNFRYRTGDGYQDHPEFETLQPLIYSGYFQHELSGDGFTRLGRFLPLELPGIGYIDGGQLEMDPGGRWSFGAVAGLKPNRVDLKFTGDEPTAAGYATFEAGQFGSAYFSGTAGLLGSVYNGEADRLAVLFDQRAGLGPKLDLFSTAAYDFGIANTTNSQNQLSRFDLTLSSRWHSLLTLRAGADHWQRVDSQAERDLLPFIVNDQLFDDGYWRYWIGASHELPWELDVNEEIAYTVSDAVENAVRWRIGLTRTGLFNWKYANIGTTFYNLEAQNSAGYGWLLRSYLPFFDGRLSLQPSLSMRWLDADGTDDGLSVTYATLYGDWLLFKSWTVSGGITATTGDFADALLFDLGLRYSW